MNHSLVNLASVAMKRNPSLVDGAGVNDEPANYSPLRSKSPPPPIRQSQEANDQKTDNEIKAPKISHVSSTNYHNPNPVITVE